NGRQVFVDAKGEHVNALSFDTFDVEVDLPAIAVFRARGDDDREATFGEMFRLLNTSGQEANPQWNAYRAGFHWRLIHPLTFLVIPILAVATGVSGRRRASNMRPILGVAILIIYHELLEEWGKAAAAEGLISPYISMWGIFAAFLAVSIVLYRGSIDKARTARVMARRDEEPPIRVLSGKGPDGAAIDLGAAAGGPAQ
ncbi:MAG: LptF/LptG family permease, partial [Parvularculaceae bacterium]